MPPKPPKKHPPPPHEKEPGKHPPPPHLKRKSGRGGRALLSVFSGMVVTGLVSLLLLYAGISINVVLPVAAPILVGSMAFIYSFLGEH